MKKLLWFALILGMSFSLTACSLFGSTTPQPLPTVVLGDKSTPATGAGAPASSQSSRGGVTASGIVAPAQEATLAFAMGGKVDKLGVGLGDRVQAGQVLARLAGNEQMQASLSATEMAVLSAQQDLDRLGQNADLATAQALDDLVKAQQVYSDTLEVRQNLDFAAASPQVRDARANYEMLLGQVNQLRKIYLNTPGDPKKGPAKAQALFNLKRARFRLELAKNLLDLYGSEPTDQQLKQADANLGLAEARLVDAQITYDRLKNGPDPDQEELLKSRLKSAQDQASAARSSLVNLELIAPFTGTVTSVNITGGEWASPGQPALALADLDHLLVKTTDLSELDIPLIAIGQSVTVTIKALNQQVSGRVSAISPLASTLGGDVVYETTIVLDTIPAGLRAGMSVEVHFGTG